MTQSGAAERRALEAGVEKLRDSLQARGFDYAPGEHASSSSGPFAVGFFRQADLEIGLIVRSECALGCPTYTAGLGYAGHDDLIAVLGADGRQELVAGEWPAYEARTGGDPFDALRHDLDNIILAALQASEAHFRESLARACDLARARLQRRPSGQ